MFLGLLLVSKITFATHIVGGEIYYDKLGGNNYKITMKVYRDCINGVPPFDNPAFITVFNNNGSVFTTLNVPLTSSLTLAPNSLCGPNTSGIACVEEATYNVTVNLPPTVDGYYIAYQRCCRNSTILNLTNPGAVGTTYWEHIPGTASVLVNSSPRFTYTPPIYICLNRQIKFKHQATDPDGDSLVYSLCTPFNGLDQCCPIIGGSAGTAGCPPTCPAVNTPPPYVSVPFASPYSASYPLASNPAININSSSGFLNGKPTILGQWVVGVCVSEYRNGVLIGTHHRDFQFNVIANCPGEAGIEDQSDIFNGSNPNVYNVTGKCSGLTIYFTNISSGNNNTYFWDFGDPAVTTDTSSKFQPIYQYTTPGDYTVTTIVNPGNPCADTAKKVFHVYPLLNPKIVVPAAQCITNNNYDFNANGGFTSAGTFTWNFGTQASLQFSNTQTVTGITYNTPGTYTALFTVNQNSCSATTSCVVQVIPTTKAELGSFRGAGCDPYSITFPNVSGGASLNYFWTFSDGTTSTDATPTHTFTPPGVYSLSLTAISNSICKDTSKLVAVNSITVYPSPLAGFIGTPTITTIFDPDIAFFNTSVSEGIVSWNYNFGDGGTSSNINPFHTYTTWNDFEVSQTIVNTYGCPNVARLLIRILPEFRFWVPNAFSPGNKDGLNDIFKPKVIGVEDYSFTIYDRWGTQIYKTNDQEQGWTGQFGNGDCTDDVYVWKCNFKNVVSKLYEQHIGHVMLVR